MINIINGKKGITLVALIITIIVMLILAGVSIKIAVDDNFLGKAEDANKMNENAINKAEMDESNALKGSINDYKVDEKIDKDFIEVYALVDEEYNNVDNNGNIIPDSKYTVKTLKLINESLSKYIEENKINETTTLYFKISNSNRKTLVYTVTGGNANVSFVMKNQYVNDSTGDVVINGSSEDVIELNGNDYKKTNSILELSNIKSISDLNGLTIDAKKDNNSSALASLNFNYNTSISEIDKDNDIIYIPKGSTPELSLTENAYYIKGTDSRIGSVPTGALLSEMKLVEQFKENEENKMAVLSEKTTTNIEGCISTTANNETTIKTGSAECTVGDKTKLYIVQELTDGYNKTIYMDDFYCEVYSPIKELSLSSPKHLPYILPQSSAEELVFDYGTDEPNIALVEADFTKLDNVEIGNVEKGDGKFYIYNNNNDFKIYSDIDITDLVDGQHSDVLKIKISATDYGGKKIDKEVSINLATNSFIVMANDKELGYFGTLSEAINGKIVGTTEQLGARDYLEKPNEYQNVTIVQNTDNYQIEKSLFKLEGEYNEDNDITIQNAFFVIDSSLNGLTYDLNGNRLFCILEGHPTRMRIEDGVTFTLKSDRVVDDDSLTVQSDGKLEVVNKSDGNQDAEIIFDFKKTFEVGGAFKYIDFGDFVSVPKYAKYRTLKTFIESREEGGAKWFHYLYYGPIYVNNFMIDFKIYLNSFNTDALQNKDYTREVEAVINRGEFNFHSGRLVMTSEEQVRAWGAWDGSIVMDIVEGFLETLRGWGLDVASITDYTSGYASLKHTGTVIKNYNKLVLGYGEGGITGTNIPYPELAIKLKSKEEGYGITMGSIFNPNRAFTRVYGVWNKDDAETTMNSGFMEMIIKNDTNNWVSLGVGRAYGIFNDCGTTYFNGFTRKNVNIEANFYGLGTLVDEVRVDFKSELLQGLENWINELLDDLSDLKEEITRKSCNGFFTFSTQKILYNFTGGATIVYTNSYAIANAPGRPVDRGVKNEDTDKNDGIIFGSKLSFEELSIENQWDIFSNKDNVNKMKSIIPIKFYYVLYAEGVENPMDYHMSTHQKIINPLNVLFENKLGVVDGLGTTALGAMVNGLNNIAFSSWIGEDFEDNDDVFSSLIQLAFREIEQSITRIFKSN